MTILILGNTSYLGLKNSPSLHHSSWCRAWTQNRFGSNTVVFVRYRLNKKRANCLLTCYGQQAAIYGTMGNHFTRSLLELPVHSLANSIEWSYIEQSM